MFPLLLLLGTLASSPAPSALLPHFAVDSTLDAIDAVLGDGICAAANRSCTLRAAIMESTAIGGGSIYVPAGLYYMTIPPGPTDDASTGDFDVSVRLEISGAGKERTVIDASELDRHFEVGDGGSLVLTDLWLQSGRNDSGGGSLYAHGTSPWVTQTQLSRVRIGLSSSAWGGGGIYLSWAGRMTIADSDVQGCSSAGVGGGIYAVQGMLDVLRSSIYANAASDGGGGIYAAGGTLYVRDSTISYNSSRDGGGIGEFGGDAVIENSTVISNQATRDGGGFWVAGHPDLLGSLLLYSATVADNVADYDENDSGTGGGIFRSANGNVWFFNTILGQNTEWGWAWPNDCGGGGYLASNHSIVQAPGDCIISGDPIPAHPQLEIHNWHGGRLQTAWPRATSPAVDAGDPEGCRDSAGAPLTTDERGAKRPVGADCDIGAIERGPCGDVDGNGLLNVSDVLYLINHLFAGGPRPVGSPEIDANPNLNVSDVLFLINHLFSGAPPPACP